MITDGGMIPYPNYEQKIGIIENAVHVAHALGVEVPKVALIDAVNTPIHTYKPHSTRRIFHKKLGRMQLSKARFRSIWQYLATIANTKKYTGKIQGDANILVVPISLAEIYWERLERYLQKGKWQESFKVRKYRLFLPQGVRH
ncbi:hypothetical protein MGH68_06755 [Erysipelothrix sp. D19-032]